MKKYSINDIVKRLYRVIEDLQITVVLRRDKAVVTLFYYKEGGAWGSVAIDYATEDSDGLFTITNGWCEIEDGKLSIEWTRRYRSESINPRDDVDDPECVDSSKDPFDRDECCWIINEARIKSEIESLTWDRDYHYKQYTRGIDALTELVE